MNLQDYFRIFNRAASPWVGTSLADVKSLGADDDTMSGRAGDDILSGGGGDDLVLGEAGNDTLAGDDGNDTLGGGSGSDHIDGGAGVDMISFYEGVGVTFSLDGSLTATGEAIGDVVVNVEGIQGSAVGADTLGGNAKGNTIFGYGGADHIYGYGGDDLLAGGTGADVIDGGTGSDTLSFYSSSGVVFALDGSLTATGEAVGDIITAVENLSGSDTAADKLGGNSSANSLYGNGGNDELFGYAGADTLAGGLGNDRLEGGLGDDLLSGGGGTDTFIGGNGRDTASYFNETALSLSLDGSITRTGTAIGDVLNGIEDLSGSNTGNDRLAGNEFANALFGNGGNDQLYGKAGADQLVGGTGNDVVDGGLGNDTLFGDAGIDHLIGGDGDDTFIGGQGADSHTGGAGIDLITYFRSGAVKASLDGSIVGKGDGAGDTFSGIENMSGSNTGGDTLAGNASGNQIFGNGGDDSLLGQAGDDLLVGGAGRDRLNGGAGKDIASYNSDSGVTAALDGSLAGKGAALGDTFVAVEDLSGSVLGADILAGDTRSNTIYGNGGADKLYGREGSDVLIGGTGADTLSGGPGRDQFVFFDKSEGADSITDFSTEDLIVVEGSSFGFGAYHGTLKTPQFAFDAASDSGDRFIFNSHNDSLYFDADGTGSIAAVKLASFTNNPGFSPFAIYII